MKPLPLAPPRLAALLQALLAEEALPPLDRWFSQYARDRHFSVAQQKAEWDSLRRALTRAWMLIPDVTPAATSWSNLRTALRGRVSEWAVRAQHEPEARPSPEHAGIPAWLLDQWRERCAISGWSDDQQLHFLHQQEVAAPVHVRFRWGAEGEACRQRFEASGQVEVTETGVYRLTGAMGVEGGDDWRRGLVEIQDAASQLSLHRLGLRPGHRVWDVCAGQGGKTLLAAAELRGKGTVFATEISENRRKVLKDRVRRSQWQNVRLVDWNGQGLPEFGPEARGLAFDRVIVDAPCSATGTWRRDPEARFRLMPRSLVELGKHQADLLRLGWSALKPGGRLAYVTCSWLPRENEAVVSDFVAESGAHRIHEELLGLPAFDANTMFTSVLEKPL